MEVSSWETHNSLEHFQHAVRKKMHPMPQEFQWMIDSPSDAMEGNKKNTTRKRDPESLSVMAMAISYKY